MKPETGLRYFVYVRKSEDNEDKQVQSIPRQRDVTNGLVRSHSATVVDLYEESRSAKFPDNRPAFSEMLKRIRRGEANGIICWHINRLSRNPKESGEIQQLLCDGKIKSILTPEREYLSADNVLLFSVEASMATQYVMDLSKAVKSGLEKKVRLGMAPLFAKLGYLNTRTEEQGHNYIKKDPERFAIVRKMWDMMLSGAFTPPQILDIATNQWGLRTRKTKRGGGKPLGRSGIYELFTDPLYAGMFRYKGVLYNGTHEAMVTLDEFDKVQVLLGREGKPRPKKHVFAYTGILKCGECGSAITACEKRKLIKSTGKLKTYVFYHCTRRKKGAQSCRQRKFMPEERLEELISLELDKYSLSKVLSELLIVPLKERLMRETVVQRALNESMQKELALLEREIKNLLHMRISESIDDAEYQSERRVREEKIVRGKKQMEEAEVENAAETAKERFRFATDLRQRFEESAKEEKKSILLAIGWNHSLKEQKLFISKPCWLEAIESRKEPIEAEIKRLEPGNNLTLQERNDVLDHLRPALCALAEEVGTTVATNVNTDSTGQTLLAASP